ncbi:MAG TPA: xanthine dehydrogenase family protein molybdopterin-binding subunit [Solirubrobacteraceae bacterium]|nr:xanthine dehydrogenase family protein molybdopterin-binding subunit [Solirubrobacteraceae bacterium]
MATTTSSAIGISRRRVDGEGKVRGSTRFAADVPVRDLLHARLVLAAEAHGRIASIDVDGALRVPGVVAVLTAADLPFAEGAAGRAGQPLAREEIVYSGQPVALVVGETEAAATDGVDEVFVEVEPLPAVLDLEDAMAPGAPSARVQVAEGDGHDAGAAHAAVEGAEEGEEEDLSDNVAGRMRMRAGDAEAALSGGAATAGARMKTAWMYQGYLEPQVATAWLEPEGGLVVSTSTQGAFGTRQQLADLLGWSHDRVRVRAAPLGGGFGGKLMIVDPLAAAAAVALERPVRVALTRMEDMAATNPAPAELMELEAGATADGRLTAIRGRIVLDRGANDEFGLEGLAAALASGPYSWQARDLSAYGVLTNRVTFGAYRAPAAPPAAFAIETLIDELATDLGLDPIELRLRNVLREGDTGPDGQPFPVFGAAECLERLREHPLWERRGDLPDGEGVGVALGYWPGGLEPAAASCRLDADGRLTVVTGAVDMSGTETVFQTIAAEAFGLSQESVRVVTGDTMGTPFAGVSGGSKIIYTVGRAIEHAARQARERLLEVAATELEIAPEDLELVDGEVRPVGSPDRALGVEELARKVLAFGSPYAPVEGYGGVAQTTRAPAAAAHLSHVRVDRETGEVTLLGHVVAQDVGRALNPALVAGQLLGGATQGFGWALFEELAYDGDGQLRTGSFVEYAIPTIDRVPPIDLEIVEVPSPNGPFGAKGVGEAPVIAVAGAVANAVADAVGVRMRELPMSPLRVWEALNAG